MSTEMESAPKRSPQTGATAPIGETKPVRTPEAPSGRSDVAEKVSGPALLPPSVAGAEKALAAGAVTATYHSGVSVTAMWSINETRNAWIHVQDIGWKKIYNGRDGAFTALTALAGQARQTKKTVTLREEADGMIYEIYLW